MSDIQLPEGSKLAVVVNETKKMMEDPVMQQYGGVVVISQQLYLWAVYYIEKAGYSEEAIKMFLRSIEQALVGPDGHTNGFDESVMTSLLTKDILPFILAEAEKHSKERKRELRLAAAEHIKALKGKPVETAEKEST